MKKGIIGTIGLVLIVAVIFSVMVGIGIYFNINSEDIDPPINFPIEGSCGDGICEINEDCSSCPSDCGVCGSGTKCDQSLRNTVGLINQANYCKVDSDCIISKDIWICHIFINRDADLNSLRKKAKEHMEKCPVEVDCGATPNQEKIKCVNNKCVVSTSSGTCGNGICEDKEYGPYVIIDGRHPDISNKIFCPDDCPSSI